MKTSLRFSNGVASAPPLAVARDCGGSRVVLLLLVGLLLGAAVGAYWGLQRGRAAAGVVGEPAMDLTADGGLSATSRRVLAQLNAPVELRFHAAFGESQGAQPWQAFAARVEVLLQAFAAAGDGRIVVVRSPATPAVRARTAAVADGMELFNLGRTEAFCGIAVVSGQQRAVLPRLSPDWEAALELDLSRAIARAAGSAAPGALVVNPARVDPAVTEEVTRALPDLATLTVEEGTLKLRAAAVDEFKAAVEKMNAEMARMQARLARAQVGGSESDVAAVRQELLELQTAQAEAMSEISRRAQARVEALQQLKGAGGKP
jgi:hypothetical protein